MGKLAFERPVRATTAAGGYPQGVESRTVRSKGDYLTYLHNETGEDRLVMLVAKRRQFAEILNVNTEERIPSPVMTLAPYETRIMRIKLR